MDNARSQTVREAFERHGLPEAIRSDNGAPFASVQALHGLSRLSAWWEALGNDSCSDTLIRRRSISYGPRRRHERPGTIVGLKDIREAPLESGGRNSRLTHNRLFPGRRAAAT